MVATSILLDRPLYGFDFVQVYLNGWLDKAIYLRLLKEYTALNPKYDSKLVKLNQALYGLCQSGRAWYNRFTEWVTTNGYEQSVSGPCVYFNSDRSSWIALYVDNGHVLCTNKEVYEQLCDLVENDFEIKRLGQVEFTLGMNLDWTSDGCTIHQRQHTN